MPWCSSGGSSATSLAAVLPFQPDPRLWGNPSVSPRNDGSANHHRSPCQSTARLGDVWGFCCSSVVAMPILM